MLSASVKKIIFKEYSFNFLLLGIIYDFDKRQVLKVTVLKLTHLHRIKERKTPTISIHASVCTPFSEGDLNWKIIYLEYCYNVPLGCWGHPIIAHSPEIFIFTLDYIDSNATNIIVDQPHLEKCSRKLFDSILC